MGPGRAYQSTLRQEQAAATRQRILDAARSLFVEHGYPATTIAEVAARAGVAIPTVTGVFANKRTLLDQVLRATVRGDGALADQLQSIIAIDEPSALISALAELIAQANERASELFEITRKAATVEPEIEARRRAGGEDRRRDMARIARELDRRGALCDGLTPNAASDILWLYSSADVYRLLVNERGWPLKRFTTWLDTTLAAALLR
jgi:AcrR family transcriptional regulator